ncbi:hypothetical protein JG688_00005727, partial [Phytophthora aleatoria]
GVDDEDAAGSTQNASAPEANGAATYSVFVSADVMGISSREVIGLRSMQQEFREELGQSRAASSISQCWTSFAFLLHTVHFHFNYL